MSADWESLTLKQAGISLIDCDHRTPTEAANGYPYVAIPQLRDGRIIISEARRISEDDFVEWTRKANPQAHDVVLSRRCNPGESAYVPTGIRFALGQNLVLLRSDATRVQPTFLRWLVKGPEWWRQVDTYINVGAVFTSLKCADIPKFKLTIPPIAEQLRISKCLSSIDDKIDLNRRINQTLEAMAQAIFKSWFVDFDPVKAKIAAKAEGRDPLRAAMSAISGKAEDELDGLPAEQYEQLAATAALFPDEMVESELGEIPEGWAVKSAESLSEVGIGKTPPRKEPQWFTEKTGDWRWVSIKDMGASGVFQQQSSEFLTSEAISRFNIRVVPNRTVLLSFKLTIGRVAITDGAMVTNEAIAHFKLPGDAAISPEYLYLYLKSFDYSTLGSTSSIADAVNSKTIRGLPIFVAERALVDRFTNAVAPKFAEIRNRQSEIASLCATRDALLPKLLSGEIEVPA